MIRNDGFTSDEDSIVRRPSGRYRDAGYFAINQAFALCVYIMPGAEARPIVNAAVRHARAFPD